MGTDLFSGNVTLSKLFLCPPEKGSTLKGKNLLSMGANSFFKSRPLFQKGLGVQVETQTVGHKHFLLFFKKMAERICKFFPF